MADEKKDVVFRRIRGRIVPIRVNKGTSPRRKRRETEVRLKQLRRKKVFRAADAFGAGIAAIAISGFASGRLARIALQTTKAVAFKLRAAPLIKDVRLRKIVEKRLGSQLKFAKVEAQLSKDLLKFGAVGVGGILIGEGLKEFGEILKKRKATLPEEVVTAATGVGVSAFALKAFKLGLRVK